VQGLDVRNLAQVGTNLQIILIANYPLQTCANGCFYLKLRLFAKSRLWFGRDALVVAKVADYNCGNP
jgi:hypothetical protein